MEEDELTFSLRFCDEVSVRLRQRQSAKYEHGITQLLCGKTPSARGHRDVVCSMCLSCSSTSSMQSSRTQRSETYRELSLLAYEWLDATNARDVAAQSAFYPTKMDAFYLHRNVSKKAVIAEKRRVFEARSRRLR